MVNKLLSGCLGFVALYAAPLAAQSPAPANNFCGTETPSQQWEAAFQRLVNERASTDANRSQPSVYTIPVIIHVIHGGQAVGTYPNLAQGQLVSQVQVLNEDFGGIGFNSGNYHPQAFINYAQGPSINPNSLDAFGRVKIANTLVQFCLATKDTLGNILPEPGIDRVNYVSKGWSSPAGVTTYNTFKNLIDNTIKPGTIWNVSKYLNIWVTDENLNAIGLLGYATFPPLSTLTGLPGNAGTATTDGFWCYAKAFGSQGIYPTGYYNSTNTRGRTCSHEIGHYVGLRHIWGDGTCATDYCEDTPPASDKNFGSASYPFKVGSCSTNNSPDGEMFMNFMDYTDDGVKYMFTEDQTTRIQTAMANSPYRKFLGTHNLCSLQTIAATAAFGAPLSVCGTSAAITLSNQSSGTPVPSYTWNVSGGAFINPGANSPMAALQFPGPGSYTITLSADNGTISSVTKVLNVYVPTVAVTGADPIECEGKDITLTATGGNYFTWFPGSIVSPSVNFTASGATTYSCLSVWPGNCKTSTVVTITSMDCTGLSKSQFNNNEFKASPNPAGALLNIKMSPIEAVLRIKDLTGKIMLQMNVSSGTSEMTLNTEFLNAGVYLVEWTGAQQQSRTLKLVKE